MIERSLALLSAIIWFSISPNAYSVLALVLILFIDLLHQISGQYFKKVESLLLEPRILEIETALKEIRATSEDAQKKLNEINLGTLFKR